MRDAIFVTGMGRSGSSALARVLSLCGGALPLELMPANSGNPTGYWEPQRAADMNDQFLYRHASSWYDGSLTLQTMEVESTVRAAFIDEIGEFLRTGFAEGGPVIVKEPRITGLLPYWISAAANSDLTPKFLHVYRDPFEVASSLAARDGVSSDHALALWLKYNMLGERDTRTAPRAFLSFEQLLWDWIGAVERCNDQLDSQLGAGGSARRAEVEAYLSPSWRRERTSKLDREIVEPNLRARVLETYDVLHLESKRIRCPDVWDALFARYVESGLADGFALKCSLR